MKICFTKPEDAIFLKRRYFRELPQHRWVIREESAKIIAHIAVHEKIVKAEGKTFKIGGIAEVCVHPKFQGHGLAKRLLSATDEWLRSQDFPFSVLFGESRIYSSSGYITVNNLFHDAKDTNGRNRRKKSTNAMVKQLLNQKWPGGEVYLPGPAF